MRVSSLRRSTRLTAAATAAARGRPGRSNSVKIARTCDTVTVINGATCNGSDGSGCGLTPPTVTVGNGAYWDPGTDTVVVLVSRNVLQVVDDVPVNISIYPDLATARQQAATALAAKILSHL